VPVVHELRGVGKNMQDHYMARVSHPVVGAQTANERSRGLPLAGEVIRWLFTGKGMLTYSPSIFAASVKVLEESASPDVQVTFAPSSFKNPASGVRRKSGRAFRRHRTLIRPTLAVTRDEFFIERNKRLYRRSAPARCRGIAWDCARRLGSVRPILNF